MKMTLLDMTQNILSSLSSDEVNSISDTTESLQVANIIKTAYFNILTRAGVANQKALFQLDGLGDTDQPVVMTRPDHVTKLEWIKYYQVTDDPDVSAYADVCQLGIEDFINHVNSFRPDATTIAYTFNDGQKDYNFLYKNDAQPRYCTCIQNYYFVFDAIDTTQDSTLQGSKTMCYGLTIPTWTMADSFTPQLDDFQFPLLLNEAKALATVELHQAPNPKAEQESKRQWNTLQRNKTLLDQPTPFEMLPNFGRKRSFR